MGQVKITDHILKIYGFEKIDPESFCNDWCLGRFKIFSGHKEWWFALDSNYYAKLTYESELKQLYRIIMGNELLKKTTLKIAIDSFDNEKSYSGVKVKHILQKLLLSEKHEIEEAFNKGAETGLEDEGDIYFFSTYCK